MSKVFIRSATYDYEKLRPIIFEIIDSISGDLIRKKSRVVIKPNLLAPASPDKAIVTHPLMIRAVAEYVLQKGGNPLICDSPASGSFEKILKESGIRSALEGLAVQYREFKKSRLVDIGEPFRRIEIAEDALERDVLVNLPKLKTHTQMLLTLGVKNLFGCIIGMRKPEWHLRTGIDREMFARLLVRVFRAVNPTVTILDGILAMEGQGPGKSGRPRDFGLVLASSDTVAIDITVCRMLGIAPEKLLTNKVAIEDRFVDEDITYDGYPAVIRNLELPEMKPLIFGPRSLHGFMRRHFVQRPECDDSLCTYCGECWNYCPARAITHKRKQIRFKYERCIRCYCCIEVCPRGALKAQETFTGRIARRIMM